MTRFAVIRIAFSVASLGLALGGALTPVSAQDANSGTPEQRRLCQPEAFKYCLGGSGGIPGIVQCLKTDPRVSAACKHAMIHGK